MELQKLKTYIVTYFVNSLLKNEIVYLFENEQEIEEVFESELTDKHEYNKGDVIIYDWVLKPETIQ